MAIKNLNTEEMLQISGNWLDPASDGHQAISLVPILKPSLGFFGDAHVQLSSAAQPAADPRLAEISNEQAVIVARHDALIRGSIGYLTGLAELVGGALGDQIVTVRDIIAPGGLASQVKTYRAKAGQAGQLDLRMTPELRAQTDALMVGPGPDAKSLSAYVDEWIVLGKKLGALEDEKTQLQAKQAAAGSGSAVVAARNLWTRVANAMVANAELVELTAEQDAAIFGPLRDAEKKADERARRQAAAKAGKSTADEPTPAPAPVQPAVPDAAAGGSHD